MYDYLQKMDWREVHAIGEIWAEILWVVSNKLIEKHGFADSPFPSADPEFYRTVTRENGSKQLVPTRDAIIAADRALTGGENKCLLWGAFASRGLGVDAKKLGFATRPSINGFKVPPECE
ncbi:Fungalysin/Thermolysin Extracellular metalloproteinase 5 [Ceratobasidium sp. 392]|nr:Fungalysin/Thermolysin Extracellular metalloproteinase 5 [Ceratobasidium sp. 392]